MASVSAIDEIRQFVSICVPSFQTSESGRFETKVEDTKVRRHAKLEGAIPSRGIQMRGMKRGPGRLGLHVLQVKGTLVQVEGQHGSWIKSRFGGPYSTEGRKFIYLCSCTRYHLHTDISWNCCQMQ